MLEKISYIKKNIKNSKITILGCGKSGLSAANLAHFNGAEIFISDNYYLLNIWSSWCIPCRDEHHFLTKLKKMKKLN